MEGPRKSKKHKSRFRLRRRPMGEGRGGLDWMDDVCQPKVSEGPCLSI